VRTMFGWNRLRPGLALLALVAGLSVFVAACGSDNNKSSTSCATTSAAATKPAAAASKCGLGNGQKASGAPIKIGGVNAELNLTNADGPDSQLYRDVLKKYAPKVPLGSFSQMGFVEAAIATKALLAVSGDYTAQSVNDAFKAVKGYKTDILCKPWYYGDGPTHVPNNTDRTTTPQGGKMVEKEGCFDISDVDPGIAAVRKWESENGIS